MLFLSWYEFMMLNHASFTMKQEAYRSNYGREYTRSSFELLHTQVIILIPTGNSFTLYVPLSRSADTGGERQYADHADRLRS